MAFRKLCSRVNFSSRDAYQSIQAEAASRLGLIQALDLTTTMAEPADPEIQRLERAWMTAWVERDRLTCERILADDFVLTSARGILMPKSDWLAAAMTSFVCTAFAWQDLLVRHFGDTAVVHGRSRQQASVSGQDWSGLFLVTDVWVKRNNQWQVVSRHGTGPISE